jgi:hypothetical protein
MATLDKTAEDIYSVLQSYGVPITVHVLIIECINLMILACLITLVFLQIVTWKKMSK